MDFLIKLDSPVSLKGVVPRRFDLLSIGLGVFLTALLSIGLFVYLVTDQTYFFNQKQGFSSPNSIQSEFALFSDKLLYRLLTYNSFNTDQRRVFLSRYSSVQAFKNIEEFDQAFVNRHKGVSPLIFEYRLSSADYDYSGDRFRSNYNVLILVRSQNRATIGRYSTNLSFDLTTLSKNNLSQILLVNLSQSPTS